MGDAPIYLLSETCLERILDEVDRVKPSLLDSRFDSDGLLAQAAVGAWEHRSGS